MRKLIRLTGISVLIAGSPVTGIADTIRVDGQTYAEAEFAEVTPKGVVYRTKSADHVVVPWDQLNKFQSANLVQNHSEAIMNLKLKAFWIEGTVFEKHKDGLVVQMVIPDETAEGAPEDDTPKFRNGGEKPLGLVMIQNDPVNGSKKESDPVEGIFFRKASYTYQMGFNLVKEIPVVTPQKPEFAREREWTNSAGQKMQAKLLAVKGDRCLFEQGGKQIPYGVDQLSEADRKLIAEFLVNSRDIPFP